MRESTAWASVSRAAGSVAESVTTRSKQPSSRVWSNTPGAAVRSSLFSTAMARRPLQRAASALSSSVAGAEPSNTARINPASSNFWLLRRMPSASTTSSVSRRPAVSHRFRGVCPNITACSTKSRVVPATGVTMARSKPASRFSSVLLPTLGRPMMAVSTPWRRTAPAP